VRSSVVANTCKHQTPSTTQNNSDQTIMSSDASDHSSALFRVIEEEEEEQENAPAAAAANDSATISKSKKRIVSHSTNRGHDAFGSLIDDWCVLCHCLSFGGSIRSDGARDVLFMLRCKMTSCFGRLASSFSPPLMILTRHVFCVHSPWNAML